MKQSLRPQDRFIILQQQKLVPDKQGQWSLMTIGQLPETLDDRVHLAASRNGLIQVGDYREGSVYALSLDNVFTDEELLGFRGLMGEIPEDQAGLISRAMQLDTWMKQHRFCGQCGTATELHPVDLAVKCDHCDLSFYPRINPCIMALVVKGEYCLLAHHTRHKSGMYSTLAGFVEAGETLEACLRREVMEEVGVEVGQLEFFRSQSWPFPNQLMMGFFARYKSGEISEDEEEILDAQWFHYSELPFHPPLSTLSGQLIQAFVAEQSK